MNLLIRVDASSQIGTGHLMRCLSLAQAWQERGGTAIFVMIISVPGLEERLTLEGIKIVKIVANLGSEEDAKKTANLANELNSRWLVVDGYNFGADYQKIIKDRSLNLLFIDDYGHANHYYADLVLNQNISADVDLYRNREPYTKLLLGTDYALLRREFWQWKEWTRINPPIAKKILVTMGGSDPDNVTLKVITALQQLEGNEVEVVIVIGGSNPHYEQLKLASQKSQFPIRLEKNVTNMPEFMAWADLAITAGGSTCWELAFMGLPSLILILAENQRAIAQKLNQLGIFINLGNYDNVSTAEIAKTVKQLIISTEKRIEITNLSQKLIDGKGSKLVLNCMEKNLLKLRLVCSEDSQILWEWANDPDIRAVSFSSEPIAWEDHIQWLNSKLISRYCIFYMVTNYKNLPIGQVRYDIEDSEVVVSVSIDRRFRYQGYGSHLLNIAQKQLFQDHNITRINAYIKPENQASMKTFIKSGFQRMGTIIHQGQHVFHLVLNREKSN